MVSFSRYAKKENEDNLLTSQFPMTMTTMRRGSGLFGWTEKETRGQQAAATRARPAMVMAWQTHAAAMWRAHAFTADLPWLP